jgi:hydroxyethylthiazole kinase-like uncharacterized protein yjeF
MAGLPDGTLMARAAHAIATHALRLVGFSYGARVLLLVGGGDNGGDALFAGAILARRGVRVDAVLAAPERAHRAGLAAFRDAGGRVLELAEAGPANLIVDGLLGIGASGPVRAELVPLVEFAEHSAAPVLAVDLPSGVDPQTGEVQGPAITAELTVCLGALKTGLLVGQGPVRSGRIELIDIGIGQELGEPELARYGAADVERLLPRPAADDDKYTRGVVGVAAGSEQYPGAAQLAVGSARLGGVGAVRYAGFAHREVSRRFPDVLVSETVTLAGRVQAWTVGPGLGTDQHAVASLEAVLSQDVPVLVDADGLNLLVSRRELLEARSAPTVLTPHDREFARLFGEVGPDRVGAARRAAASCGAVVLLKGFATVIATPDGRCLVNPTGHPSLATAGSGDVLSGFIGSLLAAGLHPLDAAAVGAYLHGRAARSAAEHGPVTADDLIPRLRHS